MKRNMGSPGRVILATALRDSETRIRRAADYWYVQFLFGALIAFVGMAVIFCAYELAQFR